MRYFLPSISMEPELHCRKPPMVRSDGCFAASGGAKQRHQLACIDGQVNIPHAVAGLVQCGHIFNSRLIFSPILSPPPLSAHLEAPGNRLRADYLRIRNRSSMFGIISINANTAPAVADNRVLLRTSQPASFVCRQADEQRARVLAKRAYEGEHAGDRYTRPDMGSVTCRMSGWGRRPRRARLFLLAGRCGTRRGQPYHHQSCPSRWISKTPGKVPIRPNFVINDAIAV